MLSERHRHQRDLQLKAIRNSKSHTCPVRPIRDHSVVTDGLRICDPAGRGVRVSRCSSSGRKWRPGKTFAPDQRGLVNDIYNPPYFEQVCSRYAETDTMRWCFEPIYGHGCLNTASLDLRRADRFLDAHLRRSGAGRRGRPRGEERCVGFRAGVLQAGAGQDGARSHPVRRVAAPAEVSRGVREFRGFWVGLRPSVGTMGRRPTQKPRGLSRPR